LRSGIFCRQWLASEKYVVKQVKQRIIDYVFHNDEMFNLIIIDKIITLFYLGNTSQKIQKFERVYVGNYAGFSSARVARFFVLHNTKTEKCNK
jgi:hypothetical protein